MRMTFRILLAALLLAVFLSPGPLPAFFGATATIVDDETGEPIEGAIALAQWMKYGSVEGRGRCPAGNQALS